MRTNLSDILDRLKKSSLFKDSFWAVFGNGIGNALLLFAGMIIARFLGKDLYGEYGLIKTTMFQIAMFSTFGLGYSSTKFIAEYIQKDKTKLKSITLSSLKITLIISSTLCLILIFFAKNLADLINAPQLVMPLRFLGVIIICRAISTVTSGLLGGFKSFKELGMNNIISGVVMLLLCIPLTYYFGLKGSLTALLLSQVTISILNVLKLKDISNNIVPQEQESFDKKLLSFSLPIALQELALAIEVMGVSLILARYVSLGEFGIYSIGRQWNAVAMMIPVLLSNLVLSYLSTDASKNEQLNHSMLKRMLLITLISSSIPFLIILLFSPIIVSLYGHTFVGLQLVLIILVFSAVPHCLITVMTNNFLANGRNWLSSTIRISVSFILIIASYILIRYYAGEQPVLLLSILHTTVAILILFVVLGIHRWICRTRGGEGDAS